MLSPDDPLAVKVSAATGSNNEGEISGVLFANTDTGRAFVRDAHGNFTIVWPINALGDSWAIAISGNGSVVGTSNVFCPGVGGVGGECTTVFTEARTGNLKLYPVSWFANDFGLPPLRVVGGGINNAGAAAIKNNYISPDGVLSEIQLGECGNVEAQGINNEGWVTGSCNVAGQPSKGFLWRK